MANPKSIKKERKQEKKKESGGHSQGPSNQGAPQGTLAAVSPPTQTGLWAPSCAGRTPADTGCHLR